MGFAEMFGREQHSIYLYAPATDLESNISGFETKNRKLYLKPCEADERISKEYNILYVNNSEGLTPTLAATDERPDSLVYYDENNKQLYAMSSFNMALLLKQYDAARKIYETYGASYLTGGVVYKTRKSSKWKDMVIIQYPVSDITAMDIVSNDNELPEDIFRIVLDNWYGYYYHEFSPRDMIDSGYLGVAAVEKALKLYDHDMSETQRDAFFETTTFDDSFGGDTFTYFNAINAMYFNMGLAKKIKGDRDRLKQLMNCRVTSTSPVPNDGLVMVVDEPYFSTYYEYNNFMLDICGEDKELLEIWAYKTIDELSVIAKAFEYASDKNTLHNMMKWLKKVIRKKRIVLNDDVFICQYPGYHVKKRGSGKYAIFYYETAFSHEKIEMYTEIVGRGLHINYSKTFLSLFLREILPMITDNSSLGVKYVKLPKCFELTETIKGNPFKYESTKMLYFEFVKNIIYSKNLDSIVDAMKKGFIVHEVIDYAIETAFKYDYKEAVPVLLAYK